MRLCVAQASHVMELKREDWLARSTLLRGLDGEGNPKGEHDGSSYF